MANYFKGDDLRSYFHSFGRAFTAAGQNFLDQAPLKSAHTVTASDVRADAVPYIDADFKLETAFNGVAAGTCILTGAEGSRTVIPQLSGILKFYDGVALTEMTATNGETFQLIDGVVVKGFMDPTDVFDSTGKKTADGYTIKVLDKNNTPIPMSKGWVVDPVNGAVTFEKGKTPANQSFGTIKIVAFAYVGKTLESVLTQHTTDITNISGNINYVSGILSGYTSEGAVKAADDALDARLDLIEAEVFGDEGNNSDNGSFSQRVSEIEKTISAYTSSNTISGAITNETNTRATADTFLSGAIDDLSEIVNDISVVGQNAISAATVDNTTTISLKIDQNDKILSQSSTGLLATIGLKKVTTGLSSGVASEYYLTDKDGNQIGTEKITIYKDQFLKSASYDEDTKKITLEFNVADDDNIQTTEIPLSGLVDTYEATSGLHKFRGETQQSDGTYISYFAIQLDKNSEKYLTVSENGLKLSGIQDAIQSAVNSASDDLSNAIKKVADDLADHVSEQQPVITNIQSDVNYISGFVSGLPADIDYVSGVVKDLPGIIDNTINPKLTKLEGDVSYISGVVKDLPDIIDNTINPKLTKLEGDLAQEIIDRQAGDSALSTRIDTEQQNRIISDNAIIQNIQKRFTDLNAELQVLDTNMTVLVDLIDDLKNK